MESKIECASDTVYHVANELYRVSSLCDMLSNLGESSSNIPADSLSATMCLMRNILTAQYDKLSAIEWPKREVRSA